MREIGNDMYCRIEFCQIFRAEYDVMLKFSAEG